MTNRRLLYVACTRAQCLLYILYSRNRQVAGQTKSKTLSEFISAVCEKEIVCTVISLPALDRINGSSRDFSVLMSLSFRSRIEPLYRTSWVDQFRTRKKCNAEFLNCKPDFLGIILYDFHNRNPRKSAGDKVQPIYLQANEGFCTVSLTGERNVLQSPRKLSYLYYLKQTKLLSLQPALQTVLRSTLMDML